MLADYQAALNQWRAETADVRKELWDLELAARRQVTHIKRLKFPPNVLAAIDTPPWERTALQNQLAFWTERQIEFKDEQIVKQLDETQQKRREELRATIEIAAKAAARAAGQMKMMAAVDGVSTPPTALLAGGSYNKPVDEVQPGFPTVLQVSQVFRPAKSFHRTKVRPDGGRRWRDGLPIRRIRSPHG